MAHPPYYLLALLPMVYLRIRRSIGYRKFGGKRLLIPIAIFVLILALVVKATSSHPQGLIADAIGTVLGAVLAYWGIRHTEFERRENGLYFRTHIWIQATVLLLFLLRMGYRFYGMWEGGTQAGMGQAQPGAGPLQAFQDPLTAGILCLLFVYNLAYFSFVLRSGTRLLALQPLQPLKPA